MNINCLDFKRLLILFYIYIYISSSIVILFVSFFFKCYKSTLNLPWFFITLEMQFKYVKIGE